MDELQHLLTMQEQQLQRQVQLQEQQCQLQEMQLRQQEQQLHLRQQEEQQKQRAQEMREQLRFMEEQQRQLQQRPPAPVPAPTPLLAAPGQLPLQEQQHQQDLLSHILLLHQSSHLQQLRQVQSEQERQLRELQQLQQPWLSPSSRGNRRPAPSPGLREAEAFVSSVRRRAPTRSSATEQDLTRRHADASPRQADASPREAAAGDVAPAPQSPEPDPWQGRWRQHQQQPPSEFMASETSRSPRSKAPTSVASPAPSRGSVRLQQDKEAIERRLRELEGD
ncbi:unnamed protein product [Effrenium voratum]|nr:unnamed protein product [Effrenium voratum]